MSADRPTHVTLGELAHVDLVTCSPDVTLRDAARAMDERGVGSVVVMDGEDLVGILTERDLLHMLAADGDPDVDLVADHMTPDVVTAGIDWEVYEAAAEMTDHHIRHLVVVAGEEIRGIVSIRDLLLAGQRVALSGQQWAILRDPLTLSVRERRRLQRVLLQLGGGPTNDVDLDPVVAEMVGSWSFGARPDADDVAELDEADHALLRSAVEEELPSLQRAVHPAPGWRQWRD